jgi:hypothetical protein
MGSDVRDIHLGGEGLDRRGFALRILLVKDGAGLRIYVNRIFLILPDFHISTGIGLGLSGIVEVVVDIIIAHKDTDFLQPFLQYVVDALVGMGIVSPLGSAVGAHLTVLVVIIDVVLGDPRCGTALVEAVSVTASSGSDGVTEA